MPLLQRIYSCENCGTVIERDRNAAINIMKRFLSHNALWTSYHGFLKSLDNLRYTANSKMKVPYLDTDMKVFKKLEYFYKITKASRRKNVYIITFMVFFLFLSIT